MNMEKVQQQRLDCSGGEAWVHGNSLVNYMKVSRLKILSSENAFSHSRHFLTLFTIHIRW